MAKQITKTEVRYTESHDRLALKVWYTSGEEMRIGSNRGSATFNCGVPVGAPQPTQQQMHAILKASTTSVSGETNGQRFQRIAKILEKTNSISEAAAALA